MRVTIEVIRSYFGTAATEEWTTAVAFPGQAKKVFYYWFQLIERLELTIYRWIMNMLLQ
jgi:hypothetical protein